MKLCSTCKEEKDVTSFSKAKKRSDGLQRECKACQKKYSHERYKTKTDWYLERNERVRQKCRDFVMSLKTGKPCVDCGGVFHHCAMDFDHLDGSTKENDVSSLVNNMSINRIKKEIEKCELVCSNCHRVRTYTRQQNGVATEDRTPV